MAREALATTAMVARVARTSPALGGDPMALQASGRITEGTVDLEEFVDFEILFYFRLG